MNEMWRKYLMLLHASLLVVIMRYRRNSCIIPSIYTYNMNSHLVNFFHGLGTFSLYGIDILMRLSIFDDCPTFIGECWSSPLRIGERQKKKNLEHKILTLIVTCDYRHSPNLDMDRNSYQHYVYIYIRNDPRVHFQVAGNEFRD